MYLGDLVGNGTKGGDWTEGNAPEIHVETGYDDADSAVGQLVTDADESFVEELCLVDAYHVDVAGQQEDACRRLDGGGEDGILVVADHLFFGIAGVDAWLEYLYSLARKLCPLEPADEFLGLA